MRYTFRVDMADGDNFARRMSSVVHVSGCDSYRDAALVATQLAHTPQPGKPAHLQVLGTTLLARQSV